MFGFGKSKQKKELNPDELKKSASSTIIVKVYKSLGGGVSILKKTYQAQEKRDEFGELISFNENENHSEDVDFSKDTIYREMEVLLNFRSLDKQGRLDILEKKIKQQERLIYYLNRIVGLNALYNYPDESAKLRDYRLLRKYVQHHDSIGSYFRLEEGVRVYEFDAVDGFLIPRWHGVDTYSSFPDHTPSKKVKIQTDLRFAKEIASYKIDTKMVNAGLLLLAINVLVFLILGFAGFKLYGYYQEAVEMANGQALECSAQTVEIHNLYGSMVADYLRQQKELIDNPVENITNPLLDFR